MPNSLWLLGPLVLAVGLGGATQAAMNTALSRHTGSLGAAFISVVGSFVVLAAALAIGLAAGRAHLGGATNAPAYLWIGGVFGAVFLVASVLIIPKIGTASFIAFLVAGQLVGSLLLDQVGAFGLPKFEATPVRIIGAALLLVGARLVALK
ncbi:MAG: DMT family transporter [Dehalococcoidia bacterium]|nr:DMT family transporter [Dehalococcoidia bacterium]